ncbi:MAG: TRASH domain-containing protein, partial [Anaerolineae bacterium]|nr:TRASH domain-containing protein [Anaerolineae bacterium]NIN96673.1 TRASH domain-containing protein [Anaerolineae bacterium]
VSVPTISAHISTLEQLGIIRGYRADIDPERLHETTLVLLVKSAPPATTLVADALAKLGSVREVMIARGPRVLALATVRHEDDIDTLLARISEVPEVLDYEHFVITSAAKEEPRAVITDGLSTSLICFQCKGPIHGEPIKVRMDGRDHYLCCHTCEKEYVERYERIKQGA